MKWFTATNENSLKRKSFFNQLKVAVLSAKEKTELDPYLLYEGGDNAQLKWLEHNGVRILFHTLSFKNQMNRYFSDMYGEDWQRWSDFRTGAYLRSEIPLIMKKRGIQDKYVLYTDCDVIFQADPKLERLRPKYFAACGNREGGRTRFHLFGSMHYNSGVMLMNVDSLYRTYEAFKAFVLENGPDCKRPASQFMQKNLFLSDQVAYNLFFKGKIKNLDGAWNWHPTRGINPEAIIIHFNGLKWTEWTDFQKGILKPASQDKFRKLVDRNPAAYEHYVALANSFLDSESSSHAAVL